MSLGSIIAGALKMPFAPIVEMIGSAWKDHRAIKQAKVEGEVKFLATEQGNRHAWEIASITNTGRGLRWASFIMWSGPLVYGWFDPADAAMRITALFDAFPTWVISIQFAMIGGIWGVKELATLRKLGEARSKINGDQTEGKA